MLGPKIAGSSAEYSIKSVSKITVNLFSKKKRPVLAPVVWKVVGLDVHQDACSLTAIPRMIFVAALVDSSFVPDCQQAL